MILAAFRSAGNHQATWTRAIPALEKPRRSGPEPKSIDLGPPYVQESLSNGFRVSEIALPPTSVQVRPGITI